ncbi:MAG: KEOPS complex kinase/ATPase Bud32 [Candidatus Thorarchaeota archaeon]
MITKPNSKEVSEDSVNRWGAEAILVKDKWFDFDVMRKIRTPKKYRISQIDDELRNSRTIIESRLLIAAKKIGVQTPFIFEIDIDKATIVMEFINGKLVKDILKADETKKNKVDVVKELGRLVGKLHTNDIIHGDLTTSNIVKSGNKLVFIDFGLGKFSKAIEDKAVDILLIKKCFISTHTQIWRELFFSFQEGYYENMKNAKSILKRVIKVEARGRHLREDQVISDYLLS